MGGRLFPKLAISIALIAITWAVFAQTLGHQFVNFDDGFYVVENENINAGLTWHSIPWAFTHVHSHNWHPLTTISHMLDCQIFGLKPGAHHLVNVVLHSVSVVLLFLLLEQMTGFVWRSAFVAAVFAIHPLHVESVAWISERKDVLSGLFFMLTLLAYCRYALKPGWGRYLVMAIMFACGLMSKPMLVTVPIILLLLDYWPLSRWRGAGSEEDGGKRQEQSGNGKAGVVSTSVRGLVLEKVPLVVLSIASSIATVLAQRGGIVGIGFLPLTWRMGNALSVYLIYIWQMIWPVSLATFYPHPGRLPLWQVAGAAGLIALATAGAFILRKRHRYVLTGWLWYLIMLLPVIGLFQVGSQAHADRYTYLPQIGLYLAVTWGIVDLLGSLRYRRQILGLAAPIVIALLGWRAWIQTSFWYDTESLWHRTFAVTKRNDLAHLSMGEFFLARNRLDDAIAQFQIVLATHPNEADANFQIGYAYMEKGEVEPAILHLRNALALQPTNSDAETDLGNVLLQSDQFEEAVQHYRNVVAREPRSPKAHYNLAVGLHRLGKLKDAIAEYKEALRIDPKYPDAKEFLEEALLQSGQGDQSNPEPDKH